MSEIRDLELKTHVSEFTVGTVEIDEKKLKRFFFKYRARDYSFTKTINIVLNMSRDIPIRESNLEETSRRKT